MDLMVNAWVSALMFNRVWEFERDVPRIRNAFKILATKCRAWPSPNEFLEVLPPPEQKALPQKPIPADPQLAEAVIANVREMLRVPPPVPRETERVKIDTAGVEESLQQHYADAKTRAAGGDA